MGAVARPRAVLPTLLLLVPLLGGCGLDAVDVGGDAPAAGDREACRSLLGALPSSVADLPSREVDPEDGWGAAWGDPAIVLRCGVAPPEGFDAVATCTTVEGIDWYVPTTEPEQGDLTMTLVNREPVVEVRLPAAHWPPAATLVDVADTVREHTEKTGSCS